MSWYFERRLFAHPVRNIPTTKVVTLVDMFMGNLTRMNVRRSAVIHLGPGSNATMAANQLPSSTLYSLLAMDDLFKDLDETLSALEQTPDNVALLRNQLRLMKELSMDTEYLDTLLRLSSLVMLDEGGMTSRSS
jgi:hypothetical protein